MFVLGDAIASFLIWRRLTDLGYETERVIDFLLLSGLAGFGLSYLLPLNGLVLGFCLILFFFRRFRWDYWSVLDEVVYGLLPGLILFQLGNFFRGHLPGKPTQLPWGIYFPGDLLRRQPVALYSALGLVLFWLFLKLIERRWRSWSWGKAKVGLIASLFLFFLSSINLLLAFCREMDLYSFWLELVLNLAVIGLAMKEVFWRQKIS